MTTIDAAKFQRCVDAYNQQAKVKAKVVKECGSETPSAEKIEESACRQAIVDQFNNQAAIDICEVEQKVSKATGQ